MRSLLRAWSLFLSLVGRFSNRKRRRAAAAKRRNLRRRQELQALEPRVVLNADPVANDDYAGMLEPDHSGYVDVSPYQPDLSNDYDPDDDPIEVIENGNPGYASFAPGSYSYSYTISDGQGGTAMASVTFDVGEIPNFAPMAEGGSYSTPHDVPVIVALGGGDDDGDALTVSIMDGPAHGSVSLDSQGNYVYAPEPGYVGPDSFTFQCFDGFTYSDPATINIEVTNAAPTADDGSQSGLHGTPIDGSVAGTDDDGDALTYELVSDATYGSVALDPSGAFTYTPSSNRVGPDSFTFRAYDGIEWSEPATYSLDVTNTVPGADGGDFSTTHDTEFSDWVSGVDGDGDGLTFELFSPAVVGSVTLNYDGTFTYVPPSQFVGSDSFEYRSYDGVEYSEPVTVTIEVTNEAPTAADFYLDPVGDPVFATDKDVPLTGGGLLFDATDPEGDALSVVEEQKSTSGGGWVVLHADGSFDYSPAADFIGTDSFSYQVADAWDASAPATVSIEVRATNVAPTLDTAMSPTLDDIDEDDAASAGTLVAQLLEGATDVDGDPLGLALTWVDTANGRWEFSLDGGSNWIDVSDGISDAAALLLDGAARLRFVPNPDFNSEFGGDVGLSFRAWDGSDGNASGTWGIDVTANGGDSAYSAETVTAYLAVNPVNDGFSLAGDDSRVLGRNETWPFDAMSYLTDDVDQDVAVEASAQSGTVTNSGGGQFVYQGNGELGSDVITLTFSDGEYSQDVHIYVDVVNASPTLDNTLTAVFDSIGEHDDSSAGMLVADLLAQVGAADADGDSVGMALTSASTPDGWWQYSLDGGASWIFVPGVHTGAALLLDGASRLRLIPNTNSAGVFVIEFRAWDGSDGNVSGAVVDVSSAGNGSPYSVQSTYGMIDVEPANAPTLDDTQSPMLDSVMEDDAENPGTAIVDLLSQAYAADADSDPIGMALTAVNDADGVWEYSLDGGASWTAVGYVHDSSALVLADGARLRFVPAADWNSELGGDVALTFRAWDGSDGNASGTVGIDVTVNGGDSAYSSETVTAYLTVEAVNDDFEVGDDVQFVGRNDVLQLNAADFVNWDVEQDAVVTAYSVDHGTLTDDGTGWFYYSPDGYFGPATITLTYSDGEFSHDATIVVQCTNTAPTLAIADISFSDNTEEDDLEPPSRAIRWLLNTAGAGDTDADDLGIAVIGADDPNGRWEYSLDDGLAWSAVGPVSDVSALLLDGAARLRFVPNPDFNSDDGGPVSIAFRAWDCTDGNPPGATGVNVTVNGGESAYSAESTTAELYVNPVNDDFTVDDDDMSSISHSDAWVFEYGSYVTDDIEGDAGLVAFSVNFGTLVDNGDGTLTYTPDGVTGFAEIVLTFGDGENFHDVRIAVESTNVTPTLMTNAGATVDEAGTVTIGSDLLSTTDDDDGPADLIYTMATAPVKGTLLRYGAPLAAGETFSQADIDAGAVTYQHDGGESTGDAFTFSVADVADSIGPETFEISVNPVNDDPTATEPGTPIVVHGEVRLTEADLLAAVSAADVDSAALAASIDVPAYGSFGTLTWDAAVSQYVYMPNYSGTGDDVFSLTITDDQGGMLNVAVTFQVTNSGPTAATAASASVELEHNAPWSCSAAELAALFGVSDDDGDVLTVSYVGGETYGSLSFDPGSGVYTYAAGPTVGADVYTFTFTDPYGAAVDVELTFDVTNNPPTASDEWPTIDEDGSLTVGGSDPDGDPLTASITTGPADGTLTVNADGTLTYSPNMDFHGDDFFQYEIFDGNDSAVANVWVTVNPVNDDFSVSSGDTLSIGRNNDWSFSAGGYLIDDVDGDVGFSGSADVGSLTDDGTGNFTYSPDGYVGPATITLTFTDGQFTHDLTINVNATNEAPTAATPATPFAAHGEQRVSVAQLLAAVNAADVDNPLEFLTAEFAVPAGGSFGSLTWDAATQEYVYTPNYAGSGNDAFTLTVADDQGASVNVPVTFSVTNAAPTAAANSLSIDHNTALEFTSAELSALLSPSDPDGDALTVSYAGGNGYGQLNYDAANDRYTYQAGATVGTDIFAFTFTDTFGAAVDVALSFNVTNNAPTVADESPTVDEDYSLTVGGSDIDADPLTASTVVAPANGTLTPNADGTLTYTPNADFHGTDFFQYQVFDGNDYSAVANVWVTVNSVNDDFSVNSSDARTMGRNDAWSFSAGAYLTEDVDGDVGVSGSADVGTLSADGAGNFTYSPDGHVGPATITLTFSDGQFTNTVVISITATNAAPTVSSPAVAFSGPAEQRWSVWQLLVAVGAADADSPSDSLTASFAVPAQGSYGALDWDAVTQEYVYTPNNTGAGSDVFALTVADDQGATVDVGVTFTVTNSAPTVVDASPTIYEDTTLTVGGADADGDPLTATIIAAPAHGAVAVNADGTVTYTPETNYFGADSFQYQVNDGMFDSGVATISITISPVSDLPTAVDDHYTIRTPHGVAGNVDFANYQPDLTNDFDPDQSATVTSFVPQGEIQLSPGGTLSYAYTITDADGDQSTARVYIHVIDNRTPVALNPHAVIEPNTALQVAATTAGSDVDNDALTFVGASTPNHGTVAIIDNQLVYTPTTGFEGTDAFTYTLSDGREAITGTVYVTVLGNLAPTAVDDVVTTAKNAAVTFSETSLKNNDVDPNGDALEVVGIYGHPQHGTIVWHSNGTFTYTPTAEFIGLDSFQYGLSDGENEVRATIWIEVGPLVTDAANNDALTTDEDASLTLHVTRDRIAGEPVTHFRLTAENGTLTLNGATLTSTTNVTYADAQSGFVFTPTADYFGSANVTVQAGVWTSGTFTAVGGVQSLAVNVSSVNDAPTFTKGGEIEVDDQGGAQTHPEWATAISSGPANESEQGLTFVVTNDNNSLFSVQPTVTLDGTLSFTPTVGAQGEALVTVRLRDDGGSANGGAFETVQTLHITVTSANVAPTAGDDEFAVLENVTLTSDVADIDWLGANDEDADGDELTYSLVAGAAPDHGELTLNSDGSFTYQPEENWHGTDTFTYQVSDGNGGTATATATITVVAVNVAPTAGADAFFTNEDETLVIDVAGVLANDSDADNDELTVEVVEHPLHGLMALADDGSFVYAPDYNFHGTDTFTYRVSDSLGNSDEATVNITVTSVNDAPAIAAPESASMPIGGSLSFGTFTNNSILLSDDSENEVIATFTVNHGGLTLAAANGVVITGGAGTSTLTVTGGAAAVNASLNGLTYQPNAGYDGTDTLTITALDGDDGVSVQAVTIDVRPSLTIVDVSVDEDAGTVDVVFQLTPLTTRTVTLDWALHNGSATRTNDFGAAVVVGSTAPSAFAGSIEFAPGETSKTLRITLTNDAVREGVESFVVELDNVTQAFIENRQAIVTVRDDDDNSTPSAANDLYDVDENGLLVVSDADGVLANDSDADQDVLTAELLTAPQHGEITFAPNGSFVYVPHANFNGFDTFTYRIRDAYGTEATGTATITTAPLPSAPIVVRNHYSVDRNQDLEVAPIDGVLANDWDPDGGALQAAVLRGPEHGQLTLNVDGSFSYRPDANFRGLDTFRYEAFNGHQSTWGEVALEVGELFTPAAINVSAAHVSYANTYYEDAEAFNVSGLALTRNTVDGVAFTHLRIVELPADTMPQTEDPGSIGGLFAHTGDELFPGAYYSIEAATAQSGEPWGLRAVIYDFPTGDVRIRVQAAVETAPGVYELVGSPLTIVLPVIDAPRFGLPDGEGGVTPVFDNLSTDLETDIELAILPNPKHAPDDADLIDGYRFDAIEHGDLLLDGAPIVIGATYARAQIEGGLVFRPDATSPAIASVRVVGLVSSEPAWESDPATLYIALRSSDAASPIWAVADAFAIAEDETLTGNVAINDGLEAGAAYTMDVLRDPLHGELTLNGDGSFSYTPEADYFGEDTFTYRLTDANQHVSLAVVTLNVVQVNDPPSFTVTDDQITVSSNVTSVLLRDWAANVVAGPTGETNSSLEFTVTVVSGAAIFASGGTPVVASSANLATGIDLGDLTFGLSGTLGQATVRVRLSDGDLFSEKTFVIDVVEPPVSPAGSSGGGSSGGGSSVAPGNVVPIVGAGIQVRPLLITQREEEIEVGPSIQITGFDGDNQTQLRVQVSVGRGELKPADDGYSGRRTFVGTAADVNSMIHELSYTPGDRFVGIDMLLVRVAVLADTPMSTVPVMAAAMPIEVQPRRPRYQITSDIEADPNWTIEIHGQTVKKEGAHGKIVGQVSYVGDFQKSPFEGLTVQIQWKDADGNVLETIDDIALDVDGRFEYAYRFCDDDPTGTNGDTLTYTATVVGIRPPDLTPREIAALPPSVVEQYFKTPSDDGSLLLRNAAPYIENPAALDALFTGGNRWIEVPMYRETLGLFHTVYTLASNASDYAAEFTEQNAARAEGLDPDEDVELRVPVFYRADAPNAESFAGIQFADINPGHDTVSEKTIELLTSGEWNTPNELKRVSISATDDDGATREIIVTYFVIDDEAAVEDWVKQRSNVFTIREVPPEEYEALNLVPTPEEDGQLGNSLTASKTTNEYEIAINTAGQLSSSIDVYSDLTYEGFRTREVDTFWENETLASTTYPHGTVNVTPENDPQRTLDYERITVPKRIGPATVTKSVALTSSLGSRAIISATNGMLSYSQTPDDDGEYVADDVTYTITIEASSEGAASAYETFSGVIHIRPSAVRLGVEAQILDNIASEPIRADGLAPTDDPGGKSVGNFDEAVVRFNRKSFIDLGRYKDQLNDPANYVMENGRKVDVKWDQVLTAGDRSALNQALTIEYRIVEIDDSTALSDDVVDNVKTVTMAAGASYVDAVIRAKDDDQREADERFKILLVSVNGRKLRDGMLDMSANGAAGTNETGSEVGEVRILDNDQVTSWGSNNVDTESTGLRRETVLTTNIDDPNAGERLFDLFDGRESWNAPFAQEYLPTYQYGYAAQTVVSYRPTPESADSGDEAALIVGIGDAGFIGASADHGSLLRPWLGVGDVVHQVNPNPQGGDGGFFGYVDTLSFITQRITLSAGNNKFDSDASRSGVVLLRRDGTSAWFEVDPGNDGTSAEVEVTNFSKDNDSVAKYTFRLTFDGLDAGGYYYVDCADQPQLSGFYEADQSGKIVFDDIERTNAAAGARPTPQFKLHQSLTFKTPGGTFGELKMGTDEASRYVLELDKGTTYEFDAHGLMRAEVDPFGNRTKYEYERRQSPADVNGEEQPDVVRLKTITLEGGGTIAFEYVPQLNQFDRPSLTVAKITDPFNRTIRLADGILYSELPYEGGAQGDSSQMQARLGGNLFRSVDSDDTNDSDIAAVELPGLNPATRSAFIPGSAKPAPTGNIGRLKAANLSESDREATATYSPQTELVDTTWQYQFDRFGLITAKAAPKTAAVGSQQDVWQWERDPFTGLVTKTKEPGGRGYITGGITAPEFDVTEFSYYADTADLEYVRYADGTTEAWAYGAKHQVTSYKNRNDQTTHYKLNDDGTVRQMTDAVGNVTTYTYDHGRIATVTVESNDPGLPPQKTRYEYHTNGKLTGLVQFIFHAEDTPDFVMESFEYDPDGNLKRHVDADLVAHLYEYDRIGQLLAEYVGEGADKQLVAKYAYDEAGNRVSITTPGSSTSADVTRTTKYEYDDRNRLIKILAPGSGANDFVTTVYEYTADNLLLRVTDSLGRVTENKYDERRQLIEVKQSADGVVNPDGSVISGQKKVVSYTYDSAGNVVSETNGLNQTTYYSYDADGNLVRQQSPDPDGTATQSLPAPVTNYTYDGEGRITTKTYANPTGGHNLTDVYSYDAVGRLERIDRPLGHYSAYKYYRDGSLKTEEAGVGNVVYSKTTYEYDVLGRTKKTKIEAAAAPTSTVRVDYRFEGDLRFEDHYDALNNKTIFKFDAYGRLTEVTQPDPNRPGDAGPDLPSPIIKYEYYRDGQIRTVTTTFAGDTTEGRRTTYTYDAQGRAHSVSAAGMTTVYEYDAGGRLIRKTNSDGTIEAFVYDAHDNVTEHNLESNGNSISSQTTAYNLVGNIIRESDSSRMARTFEYDQLNRETKRTVAPSDGRDAETTTTTTVYNDAGLVYFTNDGRTATTYTYDVLGRLRYQMAATTGAPTNVTEHGYDDVARKEVINTPSGGTTTIYYDGLSRQISVGDQTGISIGYRFDENGNLIDKDGVAYEYDGLGRVTNGGGVSYEYTPSGSLSRLSSPGVEYQYDQFDDRGRPHSVTQTFSIAGAPAFSVTLAIDHQENVGGSSDQPEAASAYSVSLSKDGATLLSNEYRFDVIGRWIWANHTTGAAELTVEHGYQSLDSSLNETLSRFETLNGARRSVATTTRLNRYHDGSLAVDVQHVFNDLQPLNSAYNFHYGYNLFDDLTAIKNHWGNYSLVPAPNSVALPNGPDGATETQQLDGDGNQVGSGYAYYKGALISTPEFNLKYSGINDYANNFNDGNVVKKEVKINGEGVESTWSYVYDKQGRLKSAAQRFPDASDDFTKVTYVYDALDRRVARHVTRENDQTVDRWEFFVFDGGRPLAKFVSENSGAIELERTYLFAPDGSELAELKVGQSAAYWTLVDGQGSVSNVIQWNGSTFVDIEQSEYRGNGETVIFHSTSAYDLGIYTGYAGRPYDGLTKLYDYNGRAYDPDLGRFLSRREAAPGANHYSNADATAELIHPSIPEMEIYDDREMILDAIQAGIGVLGMIPVIGIAFDIGNAGLYGARGKWDEVAFSLVSAIPLGGDMVAGANLARKGVTMAAKHAAQNAAAQGVAKLINPERDFSAGQVFGAALTGGIASSAAVKFGRSIKASEKGMAVRRAALAGGSGLVDGIAEAGSQLIDNGGDFGAVDWMQVTMNAGMGALGAAMGQRYFDKTCFRAGTPMHWEFGHKAVEEFKVGDRLYARDEFNPSGPIELKAIEEVFVRQGIVFELTVGGRVIGTTAEHPFHVYQRGWTPAHELRVGDLLATADGQWLPVENLYNTGHVETVYNLRIADHHTYFVGDENWGFGLWAHNANYVTANGPGERHPVLESFSNAAAEFQRVAAGLNRGYAYVVNTVKFDGFKYGKLLEAKGEGYAWRLKSESQRYSVANKLLKQAEKQLGVAGDTPIEWRFAEKDAASIVRKLFEAHELNINVVHYPH